MKVLFWSDPFRPRIGGVQVVGGQLVRALRARGHELVVVAERDPPELPEQEEYSGVPVHRFPYMAALRGLDLEGQFRLRKALADLKQSFRPDVLHLFHSAAGLFFHLKTAGVQVAPVLVTLHGTYDDPLLDRTSGRGRVLRAAQWVTACSHSVLARTREQVPEIASRSSVIHNSLELPSVAPAPLPLDPPRLLCIGRLVQPKGFDLALRAFARLASQFPFARLTLAGDGDAWPMLKRQAAELGIADALDVIGWVPPDEVPALINSCTMVVMPSRVEPFGLVALQAAQMARPVVATRVDGLPEIVVDGETGLLVEPESVSAVTDAIRFLLTHPESAAEMGFAARRRAQQVFDWNDHVSAYEALYHRLVTGSGYRGEGAG